MQRFGYCARTIGLSREDAAELRDYVAASETEAAGIELYLEENQKDLQSLRDQLVGAGMTAANVMPAKFTTPTLRPNDYQEDRELGTQRFRDERLTDRENKIVEMAINGASNMEIAEEMGIADSNNPSQNISSTLNKVRRVYGIEVTRSRRGRQPTAKKEIFQGMQLGLTNQQMAERYGRNISVVNKTKSQLNKALREGKPLWQGGPRSMRAAMQMTPEERAAWYDKMVDTRQVGNNTILTIKPDTANLIDDDVQIVIANNIDAEFTSDGLHSASGKPTPKDVAKGVRIMSQVSVVLQEWMSRNDAPFIGFAGATPAHDRLYESMLSKFDVEGYLGYRTNSYRAMMNVDADGTKHADASPYDAQPGFMIVKDGYLEAAKHFLKTQPDGLSAFSFPFPEGGGTVSKRLDATRPIRVGGRDGGSSGGGNRDGGGAGDVSSDGSGSGRGTQEPDLIPIEGPSDQQLAQSLGPANLAQIQRGGFVPGANAIFLNENSDMSTFMHEMAHWYLDHVEMFANSENPKARAWAQGVLKKVEDWHGKGPVQIYQPGTRSVTPEGRELHEAFAETFEVYLRQGKAPTRQLRDVFRQFKAWLSQIYKSIFDDRLTRAKLSTEITEIFDRMIATEDQIKAATMGMDAQADEMAKKMLDSGIITQKQFTQVGKRLYDAREKAKEDMLAHLMDQYTASEKASYYQRQREIKREETQAYDTSNLGRATNWLGKGEWYGEQTKNTVEDNLSQNGISDVVRKQRAREQGFNVDKIFYHGSPERNIDAFNASTEGLYGQGVYVSPNKGFTTPYKRPPMPRRDLTVEQHLKWAFKGKTYELYIRGEEIKFADYKVRLKELAPSMPSDYYKQQEWLNSPEGQRVQMDLQSQLLEEGVTHLRANKDVTLVFQPKDVRSVKAEFDPSMQSSSLLLAQSGQAIEFYSALERAVEKISMKQAPSDQWANTIKNLPGIKKEELEWSGIIDFLEQYTVTGIDPETNDVFPKPAIVTKEELVNAIKAKGIKVETIEATEDGTFSEDGISFGNEEVWDDDEAWEWRVEDEIYYIREDEDQVAGYREIAVNELGADATETEIDDKLDELIEEYARESAREQYFQDPQFIIEILDGGNDVIGYLFGSDDAGWSVRRDWRRHETDDRNDIWSQAEAEVQAREWANEQDLGFGSKSGTRTQWEDYITDGDYDNYREFKMTLPEVQGTFVEESHFSDPNIVAWARTTDRRLGEEKSPVELQGLMNQIAEEMNVPKDHPPGYGYDLVTRTIADLDLTIANAEPGTEIYEAHVGHRHAQMERKLDMERAWQAPGFGARTRDSYLLAKARASTRSDALFIDEAQSDWHQQGRRGIYDTAQEQDRRDQTERELLRKLDDLDSSDRTIKARATEVRKSIFKGGQPDPSEVDNWGKENQARFRAGLEEMGVRIDKDEPNPMAEFDAMLDNVLNANVSPDLVFPNLTNGGKVLELLDLKKQLADNDAERTRVAVKRNKVVNARVVPNAPFKGDGWINLIMKKMILQAVAEGKGAIAWADAQVVKNRWSDRYAELYENMYDRKMVKAANKLLKAKAEHRTMEGKPISGRENRINMYVNALDRLGGNGPELRTALEGDSLDLYVIGRVRQDLNEAQRSGTYSGQQEQIGQELYEELGALELAGEWANQEGYWIIEITPEMAARVSGEGFPLFQTGNGKWGPVSPPAELPEVRLDMSYIKEAYDKDLVRNLPRAVKTRANDNDLPKVLPDDIASTFGYETGQKMLEEMASAGGRTRAIEDAVQSRMNEEFGDDYLEGQLKQRAEELANNEILERQAELELDALMRTLGQGAAGRMAKDMAEKQLENMSIADISRWRRHRQSAERFSNLALQAMNEGDLYGAQQFKLKQLVAQQLYRQGEKLEQKAQKAYRDLKKFETSEGRRKNIATEYLEKIDGLMENYELRTSYQTGQKRARALSAAEWVLEMTQAGRESELTPEAILLAASADKKTWKSLTIKEATYLHQTIKNIAHLGKTKQRLLNEKEKREFAAVVGEAVKTLQAAPTNKDRGTSLGGRTTGEKATGFLRDVHARLTRMEFQFRTLDGKENGTLWNVLFKPFTEAADQETAALRTAAEQMRKLYDLIPSRGLFDKNVEVDLPTPGKRFTQMDIIVVALNWGNEGNRAAILEGYPGWSKSAVEAMLAKHMTDAHWDFVEGVWALIETQKEKAFALEKDITGVEPAAVEGIEFEINGRTIKGMYYPLKYSGDMARADSVKQAKLDEKQALEDLGKSFSKPMTKTGHLKERVGSGGKPVDLSIGVFHSHMQNVIHDIAYRKAVIDAHRIISNEAFANAYMRASGREQYDQLLPWIASIATERDQEPGGWATKIMSYARRNFSIVAMGYKIGTATQQITGTLAGFTVIGPAYGAQGFVRSLASPTGFWGTWKAVSEKSEFMRDRPGGFDRDVREVTNAAQERTPLGPMQRNAFLFIGMVDTAISTGVWLGGYQKALDGKVEGIEKGNEAEAIAYADSVVRRTQTAGRAQDLPQMMRGTELEKLLTMVYSYFSGLYNLTASNVTRVRYGQMSPAAFAANMTILYAVVPLMAEFLAGRIDWDEEDEDIPSQVRNAMFSNALATVPLVRDVGNAIIHPEFGYDVTPAGSIIEKVSKAGAMAIEGESFESEYAAKTTLDALGTILGLPTSQMWITGEYLYDVVTGEEDPLEDPADAAREALLRNER